MERYFYDPAFAHPVNGDLFALDPLAAEFGGPVYKRYSVLTMFQHLTRDEAEGAVRKPLGLPDHAENSIRPVQVAGVRVVQVRLVPDDVFGE